jgi:ATP-dependent helicase/nuclease subunit A
LENPDLARLFTPEALTEVALSAELGDARLHGVADKLLIYPDRVEVVDFKTNRSVPDTPQNCPDGLLRQMGAYVHALAQIYPHRPVQATIVWTRTGQAMPLPHDLVTRSLQETGYLDAAAART